MRAFILISPPLQLIGKSSRNGTKLKVVSCTLVTVNMNCVDSTPAEKEFNNAIKDYSSLQPDSKC